MVFKIESSVFIVEGFGQGFFSNTRAHVERYHSE